MSPWRILIDAAGWALIAWLLIVAVHTLAVMLWEFACDIWEARGDPPEKMDYTSTSNEP